MSTSILVNKDATADCIATETDVAVLMNTLNECLTLTVESIMKIGAIIRRLEQLEVDISAIKIPNIDYFRRIAHGGMLPGIFVGLAGSPLIMRRVSRLPIPDQERIVSGQPLKVLLRGGDHVLVKVENMTTQQTKQVFASDHIRNDSQQAAWLISNEQSSPKNVVLPPVMLDRKRHGIVVGEVFVSASDLAKYLGELADK